VKVFLIRSSRDRFAEMELIQGYGQHEWWRHLPQQHRPSTPREKARITAGAVAALVIVGWMMVLAIAFLASAR